MARKNQIEILILAKDKATKTFKGVAGAITSMKGAIVAAGALLAVKQLGDMLISTAKAAAIQESAESKLAVALSRHGESSDEALRSAIDFAGGLQLTTTAGDETTIAVQALLLNMGVLPENLNKATAASLDYAAATGKDFKEAAIQAAKTLSGLDGELGELLPDLKSLTIEQKKAGAAFDLLSSKFGGEAAAQANTFSGRITQMANAWGDFEEELGRSITASVDMKFAMIGITKGLTSLQDAAKDIDIAGVLIEAGQAALELGGGMAEIFAAFGSDRGEKIANAFADLSFQLTQSQEKSKRLKDEQTSMQNEVSTKQQKLNKLFERYSLLTQKLVDIQQILGASTTGLSGSQTAELQNQLIVIGAFRSSAESQIDKTEARLRELAGLLEKAKPKKAAVAPTGADPEQKRRREERAKASQQLLQATKQLNIQLLQDEELKIRLLSDLAAQGIEDGKASNAAKAVAILALEEKLSRDIADLMDRRAKEAAGRADKDIELLNAALIGAMDANKAELNASFDDFLSFEASEEISDRVKALQNELVLVGLTGADAINERMSQQLAALKTGLERGLILQEEFDAETALIQRRGSSELIEIEEQKFQELNAIAVTAGGAVATLLADNIKAGLAGEKVSTEDAIKGFVLAITNAALASVGLGFLSPVAGALIGSVGGTRRHLGGMITAHNGITSNPREQPIMALQGEAILSETAVARLGGAASVIALNAGTGGGNGGAVTVNIQTMDGGSMDQFLRHRGGGQAVVEFLEREGIG